MLLKKSSVVFLTFVLAILTVLQQATNRFLYHYQKGWDMPLDIYYAFQCFMDHREYIFTCILTCLYLFFFLNNLYLFYNNVILD